MATSIAASASRLQNSDSGPACTSSECHIASNRNGTLLMMEAAQQHDVEPEEATNAQRHPLLRSWR